MYNLILYLQHKFGDEVLLYFMEVAKQEVKEDEQDEENQQVICVIDLFLEEEFKNEIGLSDAKSFIKDRKKLLEEKQLNRLPP